jgi:hypothetical protein
LVGQHHYFVDHERMFAATNNNRIFYPHSLPKAQFSRETSDAQTGRIRAAETVKTGINDVVRARVSIGD